MIPRIETELINTRRNSGAHSYVSRSNIVTRFTHNLERCKYYEKVVRQGSTFFPQPLDEWYIVVEKVKHTSYILELFTYKFLSLWTRDIVVEKLNIPLGFS